MRREVKTIDDKIAKLIERIIGTTSEALIETYEGKVQELETHRLRLQEKIDKTGKPQRPFSAQYRTALEFLSNPWKLWASEHMADKRAVLKLTFSEKLRYRPKQGYRTAQNDDLSFPFRMLQNAKKLGSEMVPPHGLEPRTY